MLFRSAYDLIVAADVLCYFGELAAALEAARGALRPAGVLAFSVERWASPQAGRGYTLQAHGRYAHDEAAVMQALKNSGFAPTQATRGALRLESGKPVEGVIVVARKTA